VPVRGNSLPSLRWRGLPEAPPGGGIFLACLLTLLSAGLAQQPTDGFTSDLNRADKLTSEGHAAEAIALLDTLSEKEQKPAGIDARLGKAYFKNGKFQPAIRHLLIATRQAPEDWESVQLLALSYYSAGNCAQALPLLLQLGPHLPKGSFDSPYLTGVCYLKTEQWNNARAAFATMFSVPPESSMAHLMLAKMMVRQHLEEHAVPEIQRATALDPRLPMAHFLLGEIFLYQQSPQRALEEFQAELAINPTVWLVYWRLGDAYARLEKYDEAEKVLKQSIWLNESFTGSYLLLGDIQLKKGDAALAAGFLTQALKLDPQNYYAHFWLARACQQLGRTEEANRHFEMARALRADKKTEEERFFEGMTR
jgi:tetratricopeptide (TPR) repeat protein